MTEWMFALLVRALQLLVATVASTMAFCSMIEALIDLRQVRKRQLNGLRRLVALGLARADAARFLMALILVVDGVVSLGWMLVMVDPATFALAPGVFFVMGLSVLLAWASWTSRRWRTQIGNQVEELPHD